MAGTNVKVSYAEMQTAATKLGTGKTEITEKLRDLQTQIQNLVSSGFVTDLASKKFNTAYTTYTTSANTLIAQLTEIQSFLTGTAAAMQDLDTQIASKINS
jgi:WXG100 family type VII secretion target